MNIKNESCIDISIIIPLYKGQKFCARLLEMINENCLYENLYKNCKIEVVFVNDYPDEEIILERKKRYFSIEVLKQEENAGIQASRVKGILHSNGKYIIMLDQDDLVKENWLYSQWRKITSEDSHFCVCNGWRGRFRILWKEQVFQDRVNNLNYYLTMGNIICSPGQVIIRKKSLPKEWLENIQRYNGADDFFLWIILLKMGEHFSINNKYLYYHTPERSEDSINDSAMIKSLKETSDLLSSLKILEADELLLLNKQIERRRIKSDSIGDINIYMKFSKMFYIMYNWMKMRNKGVGISTFFEKNNYTNIAIYGLGYIGECIYEELCRSNMKVKYGIDCAAIDFFGELPIFRISADLKRVDVVIMTVAEKNEKLIEMVREKLDCPVITFSEILLDLENSLKL